MSCPTALRAALGRLMTLMLAGLVLAGSSLGLFAGLFVGAAPAHSLAPAPETDPLLVHIESISPSLPRRGNVKIKGTVTNVSDDVYTHINLHAFASATPLIDATTLAASAANDPTDYVGERVTAPGTFDTVDLLEPGDTASFKDSIPVELFGNLDAPGVYWIGIHALGDGPEERDQVADGRARTFIPLLPRKSRTQRAAVIVPLRGRVSYDDTGRVAGSARWARWLASDGRLGASLDIAESAGSNPYTWLVDPALLVALVRLSEGNPPRSLAPDPAAPGQEPSGPPTATDSPSSGMRTILPQGSANRTKPSKRDKAMAAAASSWLARFLELARERQVLALPFGDLDVSAAVRHAPQRYDEAAARSAQVMVDLDLDARPALAPESDALSPDALEVVDPDTTILLGDSAFATPPKSAHSVVRLLGHKIVVTSTGAEAGGPSPTPANDPLALRQRLLSEAAIRLISNNTAPVVVTVPARWPPGDAASFFSGLDQPWLDVVPVSGIANRSATGVRSDALAYTASNAKDEVGARVFAAADRATEHAFLLEDILTRQTMVESQVRDETLVTLSQQLRATPRRAIRSANIVTDSLQHDLDQVQVEAGAVTLSGASGEFGATVVNGLDEPVTVRLKASSDADLALSGPVERRLGPGAISVVRFEAKTEHTGIHTVRLEVTTVDGSPTGPVTEIRLRAAQMSTLIWVILAGSAVVLLGALGYRLPRQIQARRADQAAATAAAASATEPAPAKAATTDESPQENA